MLAREGLYESVDHVRQTPIARVLEDNLQLHKLADEAEREREKERMLSDHKARIGNRAKSGRVDDLPAR